MSMRLGIVADFTDRASKRMAKLLRANQKLDKANKAQGKLAKSQAGQTKAQAAAQGKFASQVERSNRLMASLKATSAALGGTISSAITAMGRFTGSISTAIRKVFSLKQALARIRNGAGMMKSGFGKVARGALVAGGLGLGAAGAAAGAANMAIGPAAQVETYMVQLEALEGSKAKAVSAMSWITDFATRTPLELNEVIEAYAKLKAFGIDPTNGSMQAMVDTMAMTGGGAEQLSGIVLAVGQAWTKGKLQGEEALQLLERGVPVWDLLSKATGKSAGQLQKLASQGKLGKEAISKLVELMGERAIGASDKLSKTWNGMLSNVRSLWFEFRLLIAQSGVFDWAKEKLQGFLDTINRMKADGSLKAFAEQISSNIIASLQTIWSFGQELWSVLQQVGSWLKTAADALGGWNRLVGVFIALPLLGTIASIITGFAQLAGGLVLVGSGIAALSLPVVAVVAGVAAVAAAAYLIYENWDGIVDWFGGLWDQIVNLASGAWDWFKSNLSWHPLALIANNWGAITGWFASFWPGIKSLAQAGWDALKTLFDWTPLGLIVNNWSALTEWFGSFWAGIKGLAQVEWEGLKALFGWSPLGLVINNWGTISEWFSGFWDELKTLFDWSSLLTEGLPAAIQKIIDTFSNINLFDAGVKILKSLWDGMLSLVDQMVSSISSKLSSMMPKLPSWLGGGKSEEVQARASGGTYGRGPLLVGERGPELSYATQGGFIAHYGQLAEMARLSDRIRQGAVSAALAASVATASPALAASAPVAVSPSPSAMQTGGNSSSAPVATSGVNIELNYAPTITVGSGSSLSEDDFEAILEEHADVLVDLIKRKLDEDGRLDF